MIGKQTLDLLNFDFSSKTLRKKLPPNEKKAAIVQLGNKTKLIKYTENDALLDEENFKLKGNIKCTIYLK